MSVPERSGVPLVCSQEDPRSASLRLAAATAAATRLGIGAGSAVPGSDARALGLSRSDPATVLAYDQPTSFMVIGSGRSLTTMTSAVLEAPAAYLPDDNCHARNLIGGSWRFPAAPYEFESRNPADSTITMVVPLSSRFDVAAAFDAATEALHGSWAEPAARAELLATLLDRIAASQPGLARLQPLETGIALGDSLRAIKRALSLARKLLAAGIPDEAGAGRGCPRTSCPGACRSPRR